MIDPVLRVCCDEIKVLKQKWDVLSKEDRKIDNFPHGEFMKYKGILGYTFDNVILSYLGMHNHRKKDHCEKGEHIETHDVVTRGKGKITVKVRCDDCHIMKDHMKFDMQISYIAYCVECRQQIIVKDKQPTRDNFIFYKCEEHK